MCQWLQLGLVHDVHLGAALDAAPRSSARAPASRCGVPVPTSDEPRQGASSCAPRLTRGTYVRGTYAGAIGSFGDVRALSGACFLRVESSGTSYLDGRQGEVRVKLAPTPGRYDSRAPSRPWPRPAGVDGRGRSVTEQWSPLADRAANGAARRASVRLGVGRGGTGVRNRTGASAEGIEKASLGPVPPRPDWKGTGGLMRELEFDLHSFSPVHVSGDGRAARTA